MGSLSFFDSMVLDQCFQGGLAAGGEKAPTTMEDVQQLFIFALTCCTTGDCGDGSGIG